MTTVADKLAPQISRPIFDFVIPEKDRQWQSDPSRFSMRQTTTMEDLDAATEAAGDLGIRFLWARISRSLVEADGKPVDQALSVTDNWSPQVREYLILAFNEISGISGQGKKDFLASKTIRVV